MNALTATIAARKAEQESSVNAESKNPTEISSLQASDAVKSFTISQETEAKLSELGEKLGVFADYDSQLPIADITGTRIVKCLYRGDDKQNAYIRLPTKHLQEALIKQRIDDLLPFVQDWLFSVEDGIVKEAHKAGSINIYPNSLSIDALIAHLETSSESGRLSGDKIKSWFDSEVYELLSVQFAEKLGLDENSSEEALVKLERIVAAYKDKFASLAGGKTFLPDSDKEALSNVLEKLELNKSGVGLRLAARIAAMNKKEDDLLMSL